MVAKKGAHAQKGKKEKVSKSVEEAVSQALIDRHNTKSKAYLSDHQNYSSFQVSKSKRRMDASATKVMDWMSGTGSSTGDDDDSRPQTFESDDDKAGSIYPDESLLELQAKFGKKGIFVHIF